MALITTFVTTPLTGALYPPWYQRKLQAWKRGEIDWDTGEPIRGSNSSSDELARNQRRAPTEVRSLLVYLRLDNMPNTLAFVSLFGGAPGRRTHHVHDDITRNSDLAEKRKSIVQVRGVRILQLTSRTTSVMKVSEAGELSAFDPF